MDASHLLDQECWEYLDPRGVKRGPFSGTRMSQWYQINMLPEDLAVRHTPAMPFVPIRELFKSLQPFKSRPRFEPPAPTPAPKPVVPQPAPPKCMAHWQYLDTKGQMQGPFTSAQMQQWFEHNMLPKTLQLRRTVDVAFATIQQYFPMPLVPFQAQPVTPSPAATVKEPHPPGAIAVGAKAAGASPAGGFSLGSGMAAIAAAAAAANAKAGAKAQPKPKSKAEAKAKAAAKADGHENGKGKGKGKDGTNGTANGRHEKGGKKDDGWDWSGNDKAWWEWSSWNGWNGAEWDGNGKQQGADWWKGKGGDGDGTVGASPPKEKAGNAVQAAFGSLPWGPLSEAVDLFPEATVRKVQDEGIVWEERWVCPLLIRFSQGKIHPFFHGRGPISEVVIKLREEDQDDAKSNIRRIDPPFPPIRLLHLKEQGVLVTLDNRRLCALQRFALQEWPTVCLARALCVDELTPTRLRAENRKFTNRLCGLQLEIESRSNAFDTFSWVTEAAHAEAPKFCRPVSLRAADKAISLLPMLITHALLCPTLRPLIRSRWPLLQLVASLLKNPRKRAFPSKRILCHHVLELPKPSRRTSTCPPLCVAYKADTVVTLSKGKSCVTSKLSVTRPLQLIPGNPLSDIQRRVLAAVLPLFCLPYVRSTLRGPTRLWMETLLLAWGKIAVARLCLDL